MYRRDEIQYHQNDIHNTIIPGLDNWLYERCPMHRLGCQFIRRRYKPKSGNLRHDLSLNCWTRSIPLPRPGRYSKVEPFSLNQLPTEILHTIIRHLDAYSLKNLRKTSSRLYEIVDDFIGDHGMVEPVWKRTSIGFLFFQYFCFFLF